MALLLHFLVGFGNAVGLGPHRYVEATRHGLNEFVLFVGRTAGGRKGTAWKRARALLAEADGGWAKDRIVGGLTSGEGLIYHLQSTDESSAVDARLLAIEQEFARPLRAARREHSTLSPVLRQAWDGDPLHVLTRTNPLQAPHHHVSILSHVTATELLKESQQIDAANGFLNRFLFANVERSRLLPEGGAAKPPGWDDLLRRVGEALDFGRRAGELHRDATLRDRWAVEYERLTAERPGLLGAVCSRAEAHVLRLESIYAVLDQSSTIQSRHLDAALAVWDYSEASAGFVFGDSLGDPIAEKIVAAIRANPIGLDRTAIRDLFQRHETSEAITAALRRLLASGIAAPRMEETSGRPREVWSLRSHTSHASLRSTGGNNWERVHNRPNVGCDKSDQSDQRPAGGGFDRGDAWEPPEEVAG